MLGIVAERTGDPPDVPLFDLDEHAFGALAVGASGYVRKVSDPECLADTIRRRVRGEGTTPAGAA